jgi:Leucine-rich repeat (LRR) protein
MAKLYAHIDYFNPTKDDDDEVALVDGDDSVHSSSSLNGDESVSSGILSIEKKVNALEDLFEDLEAELGDDEEERRSEFSYDTTPRDDVDKLRRELDDADKNHSLSWKNYLASLKRKNNKAELPSSTTQTQEGTIALKLGFENVTTAPEKLTWDDIIQRSSENSESDFADEHSGGDKEATPLHAPCTRDENLIDPGSTRRFKSFVWILLLILAIMCGTVLVIIYRPNDEPNSNQNDRLITEAPSSLGSSPVQSATSTLKPSSTRAPTIASTTVQPSIPTSTMAPTESRATEAPLLYRSAVIEFLQTEYAVDFQDPDSPTNKAVDWLMSEGPHEMDHKLAQRFTLAVLDFSLQGDAVTSAGTLNFRNFALPKVDECQWYGVYCNGEGWVRELSLNGQGRRGKIPSEIRILQDNLVSLDLSRNEISGSIPDELFQLTNLERLYVYQNQLTGGVSPKFSLLQDLTHLHASHNNLDGPLPNDFRRMTNLRKSLSTMTPLQVSLYNIVP